MLSLPITNVIDDWPGYVIGVEVFLPVGWQWSEHVHNDQGQMLFLLSGTLAAVVNGQPLRAGPGDVLLYAAGMPHAESVCGDEPVRALYLGFTADAALFPRGLPSLCHDGNGRLLYLARWIQERTPAANKDERSFLGLLLRALLTEFYHPTLAPPGTELVSQIRAFVRAHLAVRIRLDDLAAVAGLSRCRFAHVFSAISGRSPMQFVQQMRVDEAAILLRTTHLPLKSIAAATGFVDESHLARAFRRVHGVTPAAYRKG